MLRHGGFVQFQAQPRFAGHDDAAVGVEDAGLYVESDAPEEFVAAIRDWTATPRKDASRAGERDL